MDVSSSLSGPKEFSIVKRGYDPDEVDTFLDQISLGVAELKRKLTEAQDRALAAPPASAPAPAPVPAPPPPRPSTSDSAEVEEIHRALILAQRAADAEIRKATIEGEGILSDARAQADALRSEADAHAARARADVEEEVSRRREEGRSGLRAEIVELEKSRDALANDVGVLEQHVDEQREVVQAAIGELQSLLDHPEAFRISMASGIRSLPASSEAGPAAKVAETAPPPAPPPKPPPAPPAFGSVPAAPPPPPVQDDVIDLKDEVAPEEVLPGRDELGTALAESEREDEDVDPDATPPPVDEGPAPTSHSTLQGPPGGDEDDREATPPTGAVAAADPVDGDDAFLAELRKAMLDDEPLGPRDDDARALDPFPGPSDDDDDDPGPAKSRFGRRR